MAYRKGSYSRKRGRSKSTTKRRKTTKKKKTSRRKGLSRVDNDAKKQLSVMRYPHSKATLNPKIPDGSSSISLGIRYQMTDTIRFPNGGGSHRYICLYPGYAPVQVWGGDETTPSGILKAYAAAPFPTAVKVAGQEQYDVTDLRLGKWRMVSCGMKLRNVNNDDNNDGSFEAIRVSVGPRVGTHGVCGTMTASKQFDTMAIVPAANTMLNGVTFAQSNSFVSGTMKNIHRKYFQLKECEPTHDFVNNITPIRVSCTTDAPANDVVPGQLYFGSFTVDGTDHSDMLTSYQDPSMDMIVVRLNGQEASADGTTVQGTSVYLDFVASYELEAVPGTEYDRYQNETAFNGKGLTTLRNTLRRKLIKAC